MSATPSPSPAPKRKLESTSETETVQKFLAIEFKLPESVSDSDKPTLRHVLNYANAQAKVEGVERNLSFDVQPCYSADKPAPQAPTRYLLTISYPPSMSPTDHVTMLIRSRYSDLLVSPPRWHVHENGYLQLVVEILSNLEPRKEYHLPSYSMTITQTLHPTFELDARSIRGPPVKKARRKSQGVFASVLPSFLGGGAQDASDRSSGSSSEEEEDAMSMDSDDKDKGDRAHAHKKKDKKKKKTKK